MSNPSHFSMLVQPGAVLHGCESTAAYHAKLVGEVLAANNLDFTREELGRVVDVVLDALRAIITAAFHDRDPKRLHALVEELVCFCAADPGSGEGRQ